MKTIGILGNAGSFHDRAAQEYFREEICMYCFRSFDQLIAAVQHGEVEEAILAIENSTAGSILTNYESILARKVFIVGEYYKRIEFSLFAAKGASMNSIRRVFSHPMAFRQCTTFLSEYSELELIESTDTSTAIKQLIEGGTNDTAAIAAKGMNAFNELEELKSDIQSYNENYTRFFIIRKEETKIRFADKSSVCFRIPSLPGALAEILTAIAMEGFNLTKIQSMPVPGFPGEYFFYLDIESVPGLKLTVLNEQLNKRTIDFRCLGIYRKAELIDKMNLLC